MQAEERFGHVDADGDGFTNELTTADLTAVSIYQATLAVPGRVIPNDPAVERANLEGEVLFKHIGCTRCADSRIIRARPWCKRQSIDTDEVDCSSLFAPTTSMVQL